MSPYHIRPASRRCVGRTRGSAGLSGRRATATRSRTRCPPRSASCRRSHACRSAADSTSANTHTQLRPAVTGDSAKHPATQPFARPPSLSPGRPAFRLVHALFRLVRCLFSATSNLITNAQHATVHQSIKRTARYRPPVNQTHSTLPSTSQ